MAFAVFAIGGHYLEGLKAISEDLHKLVSITLAVLYFSCVLLLFIDFLGAGILKKYKWTSKIYFPIYRVFGFETYLDLEKLSKGKHLLRFIGPDRRLEG